ncbi:MAG TPA: sterol desaturase family protein [Candidatus Binatia bacterium]|nr:sterol desaturase family protein [Candidatus Binatia bacterium]
MTFAEALIQSLGTIAGLLALMAVVALVETIVPLHRRGRVHRRHLAPNLALTFITFATNLVFNLALVAALVRLDADGVGLLNRLALPWPAEAALVLVVLDFSFWVAHRAMHALPLFWRFHRVHHADPEVDVTTTIRQHPGESVIRYVFMAAFALPLGASPAAFAVYRAWSAINGLFEHANVPMPRRLDGLLSAVVTTPNMHKVHHSRAVHETDTNYGNVFAFFDRLFGKFTPSERGLTIAYGLEGFDGAELQTTAGLLALPFRDAVPTLQHAATPPAAASRLR